MLKKCKQFRLSLTVHQSWANLLKVYSNPHKRLDSSANLRRAQHLLTLQSSEKVWTKKSFLNMTWGKSRGSKSQNQINQQRIMFEFLLQQEWLSCQNQCLSQECHQERHMNRLLKARNLQRKEISLRLTSHESPWLLLMNSLKLLTNLNSESKKNTLLRNSSIKNQRKSNFKNVLSLLKFSNLTRRQNFETQMNFITTNSNFKTRNLKRSLKLWYKRKNSKCLLLSSLLKSLKEL